MTSLIRWAGSKRALLSRLKPLYPGRSARYIEPFAGSACLFFELEPVRAILSDVNSELIGCYRAIRHDPDLVIEALSRIPRGKQSFYALRTKSPGSLNEPERAARFLYLNHYCFNGLYRTNKCGEFNVPYGPPKAQRWDFNSIIRRTALRLRGVTLLNADFAVALQEAESGDFVYLDPPYVIRSRRVFAEYGASTFKHEDLDRLASELDRLDLIGATFVVSYGDSQEARKLLRHWQIQRVKTRRNISGFSDYRREAYELLATNGALT